MILQMTRPVQGGLRMEKKFEIIANHLANANTNGFKSEILTFDHMLRANLTVDHTPGELRTTGNTLDIAIADEGFFAIQTEQGTRYTRDGNFTLNNQGELVTQSGDTVLGEGGALTIQGTDININENGEIRVDGAAIGNLKIVTFDSIENLKKQGGSLFVYTGNPADETTPEKVSVKQGALESANFSTVVEMTKLIETQRMYQAYQKMIQTFDDIDSKVINEVGRPS